MSGRRRPSDAAIGAGGGYLGRSQIRVHVSIVVLTSLANDNIAIAALDNGVQDYLAK